MQSKEALYYETAGDKVRCLLCPHQCMIKEGGTGICHVRRHEKGKLYTDIYGKLSAINFDPIEKKPLYHYFPGSVVLSIGTVGCNMHCTFCQNWQISQTPAKNFSFRDKYGIEDILQIAGSKKQNIGVAYTYNEPVIWIEYVLDVARQIKGAGMKNVMVSNGFIAPAPLDELLTCMDAFNIDLKSFSDDFYRNIAGARLEPVLFALKRIALSGKHLEITHLVIPDCNDKEEEFLAMVKWIAGELGKETVLHLSRYHPMYKMQHEATPSGTLLKLAGIAEKYLLYVYVGNIETGDYRDTKCPNCNAVVIKRSGYHAEMKALDEKGCCLFCHKKIICNNP
jgi:pyruvate formate lyase activating enzyme